jgi:hypothetical protein
MMDIIEQLRDDNNYYGVLGKQYLSNSDIGTLLNNPQGYGKSRPDSKNLLEGRYFHQLLIEPEKAQVIPFVDVTTRTTKEYKNYCEENNLEMCMLKKEKEDIERLVSVMKRNITFYDEIYREGNLFETPAITEIAGLKWKGKADILTSDSIIDLKTTADIQKFKYSARSYNYDSQCYIYQTLFGKPLVFYVVDKATAQLGIFRPTEEFVRGGEAKVIRAVEVYQKYYGANPTDDIANHYIEDTL